MGATYVVKIQNKYKNWISLQSAKSDTPIYKVFEQTLYPYYQNYFTEPSIKKVSLLEDTTFITLSVNFKKTLKLEALCKNTNIVSLVNAVFEFYLAAHP